MLTVAASAAAGVITGSLLAAVLAVRLAGRPTHATALAWQAWPAAAVLVVFCAAIVMWPALRPPRPVAVRIRRGRSATVAAAATAGADIALLVLAVLAVRELRSYSAAAPVAGGPGVDPVIAAAPALALVGLAVLPLRLLPAAARGLERLSARSRRLGSALANWEISRRPLRQSGPALLVILAVGASTVALAQYESWQRSVRDQAAFAVGAPVRVGVAPPLPLSGVQAIGGLPTVSAAMPVSAVPLVSSGQLLVLDAALAARTITLRPDLAGRPVGQLFSALQTRVRPGLVMPGRPARLEIVASMTGPAGMGPVSATVTVQDADGVGYAVATSAMPADGKPHALVARLGGGGGAAYPLRLIGISVSYTMPAYPQSAQARLADQQTVLELDNLRESPALTGQFSRPVAAGRALGSWLAQAADPGLAAELATLGDVSNGAVKPSVASAAAAGSAERITFRPGNWPLIQQPPGPAELDYDVAPAGPVLSSRLRGTRRRPACAPARCSLSRSPASRFPAGSLPRWPRSPRAAPWWPIRRQSRMRWPARATAARCR